MQNGMTVNNEEEVIGVQTPPAELWMSTVGAGSSPEWLPRTPPTSTASVRSGEGAEGASHVCLWEIELSVIIHCDSQADHMDNFINRGCVPVSQQAS